MRTRREGAGGTMAPVAGVRPARTGSVTLAAFVFALVCASPAGAQTVAPPAPGGPPAASPEAPERGLEARIEDLERRLGASALLDLAARVDGLAKEIQVLRERADVDAHTLERLRVRQQDLYAELDRFARRTAQPTAEVAGTDTEAPEPQAGTDAGSAPPTTASPEPREPGEDNDRGAAATEREPPDATEAEGEVPGTAAPEPEGGPAIDPVEEQDRYQRAFDLLNEGSFENAATAFAEFLDTFPESRKRDKARFWKGECLYALRRFEPALSEFRRLVEDHPDSSRIPGARLKIGLILHELGRIGEAEEELKALVEAAPDTSEAKLARDRLERLR